jgi:hypothetical protein
MKTFEYTRIDCALPSGIEDFSRQIADLGKKGWELVSVCPTDSNECGLSRLSAFLKKESTK